MGDEMSEDDVRAKISEIDDKRERARLLTRMADWPMFAPSSVKADKSRGIFRWFGVTSATAATEVELTRDERSELRDWLYAKATRLNAEADAVSARLGSGDES